MKVQIKPQLIALILLSAAMPLAAQSTTVEVYAESFRQGPTHIIEDSFEAKLTPQDAVYRERIKDEHGDDRYAFSITPKTPEGDTQITSWVVRLSDLRHPMYDNVLLASRDPFDEPKNEAKNALCRLSPSNVAAVPAGAKRIIKVDGFYVVLQVKAYHFTPPDSPYLDSMTVAVEFRNTDPRQAENSGK